MLNWLKKYKIVLISIIILIILGLSFFGGYRYYGFTHPVTPPTSDTLYVWDTIFHDIHHYHVRVDTILKPVDVIIPQDVDTALILKDYFAIYKYDREWNDSTLEVYLSDTISQNKIMASDFLRYKLLKPQTTIINNITNVTTYRSYINVGINSDYKFKHSIIGMTWIGPKYSIGAGYGIQDKTLFLNAGVNIIQLK